MAIPLWHGRSPVDLRAGTRAYGPARFLAGRAAGKARYDHRDPAAAPCKEQVSPEAGEDQEQATHAAVDVGVAIPASCPELSESSCFPASNFPVWPGHVWAPAFGVAWQLLTTLSH